MVASCMIYKMDISRKEVRLLLLHEFRLGHKATEAVRNICISMGEHTVSYDTAKRWFQRFKEGNFDLEDEPHQRRSRAINIDFLKQLIDEEPRLTVRGLADRLGCSHSTVDNYLHELGKVWRSGVWVPHDLTQSQRQRRVDLCMQNLTSHRNFEWLRNLITADEKWVLYVNHTRKRQWLSPGQKAVVTPKPDSHQKKVMLSVWWGINGIIHWELLPNNTTVTADLYCAQLDVVAKKLKGKQDRIYFLHDNARPHIAKKTYEKLLELGWTVIAHPPYSPDLAPTDYHLFRSLSHYLCEKKFDDEEDLKNDLINFFNNKSKDFYERGIMTLPNRWQQVIDTNGEYLHDP